MNEHVPGEKPVITQQMIDLYDDFTHRSLDRRKFMDDLARLVGSATAATVAASMMAASAKAEGITSEADPDLSISTVSWQGAVGEMTGYQVTSKNVSGPVGGVIVVHENRGLNAHIKDVARRMAKEGFVVLAPDFLSSLGGTPADEDEARALFGKLDREMVARNGVAAVEFLAANPATNGKIGAVGFCWGGGSVNAIAVQAPKPLKSAVAYYGAQAPAADVARIKARLMLHYAGLDERINAGIDEFKAALDAAHTDYELFIYEGANHAFNNDTSEARYDKAVANLAWSRTIGLFKQSTGS